MHSHGLLMKAALALGIVAAAGGVAVAQQGQPPAEQQPPALRTPPGEEGARQLINDMQQIQQRLISVQEQALANNPKLQEQAESYQATLLAAMREEGFDPQQALSHIELIEKQIQSETLNEQERQGLMAEVREEEEALALAEQQALQRENVQKEREALMQGMLVAMREEEPRTDQLIQELEEKNAELRSIMTAEAPQAAQ